MSSEYFTGHEKVMEPGYYLIKESDKSKHFIGKVINTRHLEKVADKVLTDTDFEYYIDFYHGLDIRCNERWSNTDLTDLFI